MKFPEFVRRTVLFSFSKVETQRTLRVRDGAHIPRVKVKTDGTNDVEKPGTVE